MCNIMDVLNYAQQYIVSTIVTGYFIIDILNVIRVKTFQLSLFHNSSHILINSLRYNVISSNLMKIRSLLRFKILIIIKITPFTLASKFGQLYSAKWYICLWSQGLICCSYNRHCPLVLSVFKPATFLHVYCTRICLHRQYYCFVTVQYYNIRFCTVS